MADLAALGFSANLVKLYRPNLNAIRINQDSLDRLVGQKSELERLLRRVEVGELTVVDTDTKRRLIAEGGEVLAGLEEDRAALQSAVNAAPDIANVESHIKARTRLHDLQGEILGQKARVETLESLELAATPDRAENAIRGKLAVNEAQIKATREELKVLRGNFLTRFGKGTVRLLGTALGVVAVVDFGTRAYVIFLEGADPGVFPALELAADGVDANRPLLREIRDFFRSVLRSFQEPMERPSVMDPPK